MQVYLAEGGEFFQPIIYPSVYHEHSTHLEIRGFDRTSTAF